MSKPRPRKTPPPHEDRQPAQEAACPPQAGDPGQEAPAATPPHVEPQAAEVDLPEGLSPREATAVEALLQQPTIARAATAVGVHERTLRRWMSGPSFRAALLEARRTSFAQAIGLTQSYAVVAVTTLVKVMNDPAVPAHCRVSAAAVLLRFGREGIELDDLADRIVALERAVVPTLPGIAVSAADQDQESDEQEAT